MDENSKGHSPLDQGRKKEERITSTGAYSRI